ncbi:uncharacterized protein LOC135220186 [Macrobrachium nipponense]|uniref:uncharacterized protein LOC135220186 n=1 Tax=Macrobrachium nipponense TaxID=159736 RepID=UPI0030C89FB4
MNVRICNRNHISLKSLLIAHLIFEFSHNVKGDYFTVNWTEASDVGMKTETHYQDPSVTPLAPCPCDLTSYQCDARCCCDKDCSEIDKDLFTCLEGIEGGQQTPQDFDYNCITWDPILLNGIAFCATNH